MVLLVENDDEGIAARRQHLMHRASAMIGSAVGYGRGAGTSCSTRRASAPWPVARESRRSGHPRRNPRRWPVGVPTPASPTTTSSHRHGPGRMNQDSAARAEFAEIGRAAGCGLRAAGCGLRRHNPSDWTRCANWTCDALGGRSQVPMLSRSRAGDRRAACAVAPGCGGSVCTSGAERPGRRRSSRPGPACSRPPPTAPSPPILTTHPPPLERPVPGTQRRAGEPRDTASLRFRYPTSADKGVGMAGTGLAPQALHHRGVELHQERGRWISNWDPEDRTVVKRGLRIWRGVPTGGVRGAGVPFPLAGVGASASPACVADPRVSGRCATAGLRALRVRGRPATAPPRRGARRPRLPVCTRGGGGSPLTLHPGEGLCTRGEGRIARDTPQGAHVAGAKPRDGCICPPARRPADRPAVGPAPGQPPGRSPMPNPRIPPTAHPARFRTVVKRGYRLDIA